MWALVLSVMLVGVALSSAQSARATPGEVLVPRSDGVRLYEEPRSTAPVLHVLKRGHRLLEFRREGGWVNVGVFQMVGKQGWIRGGDVVAERAMQDPPQVKPAQRDSGDDEAGTREFVLDIGGTPAIKFRANCHVVASDEETQEHEFVGLVPHRVVAKARAILCTVRKADAAGRLKVTLLAGKAPIAAARTRAAFNWVRVRSDGPWGPAGAHRGSVGLVLPRAADSPGQESTVKRRARHPVPMVRVRQAPMR